MLSIFQNEWNIIDWNLNICCKMERNHKHCQQTPMSTKLTTMLLFLRDDHSDGISACSMVKYKAFWNMEVSDLFMFELFWKWIITMENVGFHKYESSPDWIIWTLAYSIFGQYIFQKAITDLGAFRYFDRTQFISSQIFSPPPPTCASE